MNNEDSWKDQNPWHPMTDMVDKKTIGKFIEELGECIAAAARCFIQGIKECEPVTLKPNVEWLEDEIADVEANIILVKQRFKLNETRMTQRRERKIVHLSKWHSQA